MKPTYEILQAKLHTFLQKLMEVTAENEAISSDSSEVKRLTKQAPGNSFRSTTKRNTKSRGVTRSISLMMKGNLIIHHHLREF
jgi:hypothetical protein